MEKQMDTSEYSDKCFKYTVNKEGKDEIDDLIEELEARFPDIGIIEDYPTVEDILAMFDDNGNRIEKTGSEDNFDEFFEEWEMEYGKIENPEKFLSVEEILKMYDDNGNRISEEVSDEEKIAKRKRQRRKSVKQNKFR